jgi:hypothetical protein
LSLDLTQDLETFNESKFLDIKELFNDKEFIKLDEEALAKLNN